VIPSLRSTTSRRHQVQCLSNLGRIAAASLTYAAEDPREQLSPLHRLAVLANHAAGFTGWWSWRTALPCSFGGVAAAVPMPTSGGHVTIMMDPEAPWADRPLNSYFPSEEPTVFRCPADVGYPKLPEDIQDVTMMAPPEATGIRCFDYLGNSYRSNGMGIVWPVGPLALGRVVTGVEGHGASSIPSPTRTVLYPEPLFYMWVYAASKFLPQALPDELRFPGWHGEVFADNVAYCDRWARLTQVGELQQFTHQELEEMNFSPGFWDTPYFFLRRGATWSMDTYNAPGSVIRVFSDTDCMSLWREDYIAGYTGWPFDDYAVNECPYSP